MAKVETGTEDLLAENQDGVGIITLNRPEARNAMSGEMNAALSHQPISQKNIAFIEGVVSLKGTPWAKKVAPQP